MLCLSSLLENICLWFTPNKKPRIQILFIFIDTHTYAYICNFTTYVSNYTLYICQWSTENWHKSGGVELGLPPINTWYSCWSPRKSIWYFTENDYFLLKSDWTWWNIKCFQWPSPKTQWHLPTTFCTCLSFWSLQV